MWLKLCLFVTYIFLLFIISRVLDAISWCETGYGATFSRHLLDPMVLSVAKLKAILEQRGVSYESIIEKTELNKLVDITGELTAEEAELAKEESDKSSDTNFTSGAHFIEQVEDAKDSVWLVQILSYSGHPSILSNSRWRSIRRKASKFGVRTGILDCALDYKYCYHKGWNSPFLLLALPSQFEKKANVAMYNYSGSVKETAILQWVHDKLNEKVQSIKTPEELNLSCKSFPGEQINLEIRTVFFTKFCNVPMFFSALSVKFPGRVKFGVVCIDSGKGDNVWSGVFREDKISRLPAYVIYSQENSYIYGSHPSELYSFDSMEIFLKFLYPCLNDIFILSFCVANVLSWFELFISNCGVFKRVRKLLWCIVKYNIIVIMLWLPIIGIFQMPFLDRIPPIGLKFFRIMSASALGTILRNDFIFFLNSPIYVYCSFAIYLAIVAVFSKKYREEDQDEDWFNFAQMRTLTYLRPNDFFEPMRIGGSDFLGGLEIFGTQATQPSLWLQPSVSSEYIKYLPTWPYSPKPLCEQLQEKMNQNKLSLNEQSAPKVSCAACWGLQAAGQTSCTEKIPPAQIKTRQESHQFQSSDSSDHAHQSTDSVNSTHVPASKNLLNIAQESSCLACSHNKQKGCSAAVLGDATSCNGQEQITYPGINPHSAASDSDSEVKKSSQLFKTKGTPGVSGFPMGYLETYQCVICLDDLTPGVMLCGLPCGHVFHETCIIKWLNQDKHLCPMCRWPSYCKQSVHRDHIRYN